MDEWATRFSLGGSYASEDAQRILATREWRASLKKAIEVTDAFTRPACRVYADTANYGLPPRTAVAAMERELRSWSDGSASWMADWDPAGDECRKLIAPFLGASEREIALLPAVSVGAGLVAANLHQGDEVLVPEDEFRSILFPMLAAGIRFGLVVRRAPFAGLADAVRETTSLVVTSHVRSNGGGVQDLAAVAEAAKRHGARVLVDATHSAGVLPVDAAALGLDYVLAAAYKHLLCPRGVAFMRMDPSHWKELAPVFSGWRSAREPYVGFYGGTLEDLHDDAARFDVSLAWHPWIGAQASLEFLASVEPEQIRRHTIALACQLAEELGLEPTGSSILGIPTNGQLERAKRALAEAGVAVSFPAGQIRASFHLYNDASDVQTIAAVLGPILDLGRRTARSAL